MGTNRVNFNQTPKERRLKYNFVRMCGCSHRRSGIIRDWTKSHIVQFLHNEMIINGKRKIK